MDPEVRIQSVIRNIQPNYRPIERKMSYHYRNTSQVKLPPLLRWETEITGQKVNINLQSKSYIESFHKFKEKSTKSFSTMTSLTKPKRESKENLLTTKTNFHQLSEKSVFTKNGLTKLSELDKGTDKFHDPVLKQGKLRRTLDSSNFDFADTSFVENISREIVIQPKPKVSEPQILVSSTTPSSPF